MTIWSWIHFISFVFYLFLFGYIIGRGPKIFLNWLAAILMFCFALWSWGNSMMFNNFSTIESSKIILKIEAPGWIFFSSVYLLFILEFTEKTKLSRNPFVLFLFFLIPLIIYISYFTGGIVVCCDKTYFGYTGRWLNTIWVKLFYFYYLSFFIAGIYFLFDFYLHTKNIAKKNTSLILIVTMLICFILGSISSVILKALRQYTPLEADIYILLFAAGVIYSMLKYEFLSITPTRATDLIINTMSDALILLNKEEKIIEINKSAFTIFECDKIRIEDCNHILPQYILDKIKTGIKNRGAIINEEINITTLKDNKKTLLLSASVLKDKNEILGYVCVLKDITELKLAKSELEETIVKLVKSNKELEQFAYIISHDLKEPLRMIASYVQLLQKRYKDKLDSDANEFIHYAVDGAKRMNDLINGLLDYSRVLTREMVFEEVDIKKIIEDVLVFLKFKIEEKKAQINIKSELPIIKVNKINIARVFQNLIDNALKFCKEKPIIEIFSDKKENFYIFCVKDNGIGIDKENSRRIFEIFQRLNPREEYEGVGIGLAICKKIIERHNGEIWVESEGPGKGSMFCFTLPAD
ncbi:MAG: ATP-binding protein [Candidatus Goldbacteria bacterium]|nr:ATP-binding protein [Candidatus Goldiibacteriota bacterium]